MQRPGCSNTQESHENTNYTGRELLSMASLAEVRRQRLYLSAPIATPVRVSVCIECSDYHAGEGQRLYYLSAPIATPVYHPLGTPLFPEILTDRKNNLTSGFDVNLEIRVFLQSYESQK